jgi:hypothetical protein
VIIKTGVRRVANDAEVAAEVRNLLQRRGAMANPPVSLAVSDAVALGIAALFGGPTPTGRVMDRFARTGAVDSDELLEAARFEQGYASPEGHAALHCLIGWARSRAQRNAQPAGAK